MFIGPMQSMWVMRKHPLCGHLVYIIASYNWIVEFITCSPPAEVGFKGRMFIQQWISYYAYIYRQVQDNVLECLIMVYM